jgi:hypothetical protein
MCEASFHALKPERTVEFKKTIELPSSEKLTHRVVAMSHKASSHAGHYLSTLDLDKLSTLDLDKIREFYDAFWVFISNPRRHKDQRRRGRSDWQPCRAARSRLGR